jgi:hypothetical protein
MKKPWYKSRTIWLNIITAVATMSMILSGDPAWAEFAQPMLMINALANAAMRIITVAEIE